MMNKNYEQQLASHAQIQLGPTIVQIELEAQNIYNDQD